MEARWPQGLARAVLLVTISLLTAGCDATGPATPFPSLRAAPSPSPTVFLPPRSLTPGELADSVRFRNEFGLKSDEQWIRTVAGQPDPDWTTYAVPLTPAEVAELNARTVSADAISGLVTEYGQAHPDVWAGAYIDNHNQGTLVVQFSANLDEHRLALLPAISPSARIEFRQVRYSLGKLQQEADRVRGTDSWFRDLPAVLTGYGVDVVSNTVLVKVSSIDPAISEAILTHFGWPAGFVTLESDGTGALLIKRGSVRVTVKDASGRAVSGVRCVPMSDLTGRDVSQMPIAQTNQAGVCVIRQLLATGYWIRIQRDVPGPGVAVLGFVRAVVTPGETQEVALTTK